jgi:hypothetical protein
VTSIRAWCLRLAALVRGATGDEDLAAELESHLQCHIDDNIRAGMTPAAARRDALITLGGLEATCIPDECSSCRVGFQPPPRTQDDDLTS